MQELADIEAKKANIVALHSQYVQSQQVSEPPELTPEEKAAKPWDKMDWDDGLELARTSKYGADIDANDPNVQCRIPRSHGPPRQRGVIHVRERRT